MTSFLHTASAKLFSHKLKPHENHPPLAEGFRLLLIEPDNSSGANLSFSLAMDAALSAVSSSAIRCRGCQISDVINTRQDVSHPLACRCCKVSLLISTTQRRRKEGSSTRGGKKIRRCSGQKLSRSAEKANFPMRCRPEKCHTKGNRPNVTDNLFSNNFEIHLPCVWDKSLLGQIHIKYVSSLVEVTQYLAYAPSLPEHLQPLEGIFLLGIGELLSKEKENKPMEIERSMSNKSAPKIRLSTEGVMQLSHTLALLADTGDVLEEKRRLVPESCYHSTDTNQTPQTTNNYDSLNLIVTLDCLAYSSIPPGVLSSFGVWMGRAVIIRPATNAPEKHRHGDCNDFLSAWELFFFLFDHVGEPSNPVYGEMQSCDKASFSFKVVQFLEDYSRNGDAPYQEIVWVV